MRPRRPARATRARCESGTEADGGPVGARRARPPDPAGVARLHLLSSTLVACRRREGGVTSEVGPAHPGRPKVAAPLGLSTIHDSGWGWREAHGGARAAQG